MLMICYLPERIGPEAEPDIEVEQVAEGHKRVPVAAAASFVLPRVTLYQQN